MTTDGRTRRAEEQREARRAQIFDAALEVFATKGYHQTSISDVVAAAGVARGTFYLYFDSKNAIFHALLDDLLATIRGNIVGVDPSREIPIEDQLRQTVARILRTLADNRAFCKILFREAVGLDAEVDAKLQAFYGDLRTYVVAALMLGQQLGVVRREIDTGVAAWCVLGSIKEVVARYLVDGDVVDLEQVALAVLDFNLRGVVVP